MMIVNTVHDESILSLVGIGINKLLKTFDV